MLCPAIRILNGALHIPSLNETSLSSRPEATPGANQDRTLKYDRQLWTTLVRFFVHVGMATPNRGVWGAFTAMRENVRQRPLIARRSTAGRSLNGSR